MTHLIAVETPPVAVVEDDQPIPWRFTGGGAFVLDTPADPQPLWGAGENVLLADGEALVIAGGQGAGKTTLAQQLALGRCGFPEYDTLLGFPIEPGERVLYLAMDRPRQAARSFRRMVGEAFRNQLDERLKVWEGPPPGDLARHPSVLTMMCRKAGADTVIIDSLKDAAVGLNEDEVGAGWNRARQTAITDGIQVVELHHNRKASAGTKGTGPTIDDLYGSTWITSGAGSVILLTGAPGDPVVRLQHLKQPAGEVGPLQIVHDHTIGRSTIWESVDVVALAAARLGGITAIDTAKAMFETDKPSAAEKQKARRKLDAAVRSGELRVLEEPDPATGRAGKWGSR